MPNHASCAIVNEFVRRASIPIEPQMKLHFLVYLANGWSLAIHKEPLTEEAAEAWDAGPVFPSVWRQIRDYDTPSKTRFLENKSGIPFQAQLTESEKLIIERVLSLCATVPVLELARKHAHRRGTPWYNAFFGRGRNAQIDGSEVAQHFAAMAMAGRERDTERAAPSETLETYRP